MLPTMKRLAIPVLLASMSAVVLCHAAEQTAPPVPKAVYPLPVPEEFKRAATPPTPAPNSGPAEAVTQPFKAAVRVPAPKFPVVTAPQPMTNLVFDAEVKEATLAPEEFDLHFDFALTNVSEVPVIIGSIRTSCGCTIAEAPDLPWKINPGAAGQFGIAMDLRGKRGSITKSVFISTDQGNKTVYVRGIIPVPATMNDDQRARNQMLAKVDRQAVFKGECASCHAAPTINKSGSALFAAACEICHSTAHRAEMVPDLHIATGTRDMAYWKKWITEGKEGTLMPAFAKEHGGPLTDAQIMSLVDWLSKNFASGPVLNTPPNNPGLPIR